jgi:hypothetical protein
MFGVPGYFKNCVNMNRQHWDIVLPPNEYFRGKYLDCQKAKKKSSLPKVVVLQKTGTRHFFSVCFVCFAG